jgi:hypothetical protein
MRLRRSGSGAQRLPLRVGEWLGRATSNISLSASLLRSVMRHDEPGSSKALNRHVLGDCFRCGAMGPLRSSVRATPELMSEPILMMHVARPSPNRDEWDRPVRLRSICLYSSSEVCVSHGASGFVRPRDSPQSFTKNLHLFPMVSDAGQSATSAYPERRAGQTAALCGGSDRHAPAPKKQGNGRRLRTTHDPRPMPLATSITKTTCPSPSLISKTPSLRTPERSVDLRSRSLRRNTHARQQPSGWHCRLLPPY